MAIKRLIYLLNKRHAGSLTEDEYNELELWYQHVQETNPVLFDGNNKEKEERETSEMFEALMKQINLSDNDNIAGSGKQIFLVQRWSIAAAFIAVAITSFLIFFISGNQELQQSASHMPLPASPPKVVFKNQTDRSVTYYLEDSSKVTLSANSAIKFNRSFAPDKREVYLSGKAFFKVKSSSNRPFTVHSNKISTTALGTSFTITAFENDSTVTVTLHEGKVVVKSADSSTGKNIEPVYLQQGEQIHINAQSIVAVTKPEGKRINKKQHSVSQRTVNEKAVEVLSFEQQPLSKVLNTMADYYGLQINYSKEEIKDLEFSGVFSTKDDPGQILHRIAILNGLSVKKLAQGYVIRKN